MKEELVELRNPKPEIRMRYEGRNPKAHLIQRLRGLFGFRVSAFFRPSDLGLRSLFAGLGVAAQLAAFLSDLKSEGAPDPALEGTIRISGFGLLSAFGSRPSEFVRRPWRSSTARRLPS